LFSPDIKNGSFGAKQQLLTLKCLADLWKLHSLGDILLKF
jgi:hypothetical protein